MLTTLPEEEHQSTLTRWRGAEAWIWLYHASLRRVAIALSIPHEQEILCIGAVGCQHITGPFAWDSADLRMSDIPDVKLGTVDVIRDGNAGFELRYNGGLILVQGSFDDIRRELKNFYFDVAEEKIDESTSE